MIISLALGVSIAVNADAQPVESFRASVNITPQVESYQIARSGDLTPSLYTGAMTYSLPLYTYTDPDFNLPISLDYNYDGYKVTRSAGTVGLGWALNYGGVITREIRGYKDEYRQQISTSSAAVRYGYYWAYRNHTGLGTNFTINRPRTPALVTATPAELVRHLNDDLYEDIPVYTSGDSYDLSPDLFHFSFGPYSGDFLMNNDGTLTLTSSTHPQGEIDVIVETTTGMDGYSLKFTIKTGDGYEYTFGDAVSAREYHISSVIKDECPDDGNIAGTMSGWTDTAWKLTKIKAPNGRIVLFSYAEKPNLTPTITYSYSTYTELLPTSESMPTPRDSVPSWERVNLNYGYSHPIEQISICNANKSRTESTISFSWEEKTSSEDEMSAANYENITVSSYLNSHPLRIRNVKLSSVSIKNGDNETIRQITLNQSTIGSSSGPKRILLESVGYPDGRILTSAQLPVSNVADCWQVKDHLGNVRVLFCLNPGGYMPVLEVNDYLPFGSRIQDSSLSAFSLNRYRYAGKEEHNGFAACDGLTTTSLPAIDFGARFLTPFLGFWISPDPKSSKYLSISPYAYCADNPILFFDDNGADIVIGGKNNSSVTIQTNKINVAFSLDKYVDWGGNYTIEGAGQVLTAALDIAGCFDQTGTADIINAGLQFSDRQYLDGLMSVASAIPIIGDAAKLTRIDRDINAISNVVSTVGTAGSTETKFLKFTRGNFRQNLIRKTGVDPVGMEAHHMLPVKFKEEFEHIGINIHDPIYGQWIEKTYHRQNAYEFNNLWFKFWKTNPNATKKDVYDYLKNIQH